MEYWVLFVTPVFHISFEIYGTRHVLWQFAIQFQLCCLGQL